MPAEGEELDTRDVVPLSDLRANDESDDECRVYLIGRRSSPNVSRYRDFLPGNLVPSRWVDIERDPLIHLLGVGGLEEKSLPLFLFPDGSYLETPPAEDAESFTELRAELAERVGLHARPVKELYDLLVVGAGPAGLTAAVYAASED